MESEGSKSVTVVEPSTLNCAEAPPEPHAALVALGPDTGSGPKLRHNQDKQKH